MTRSLAGLLLLLAALQTEPAAAQEGSWRSPSGAFSVDYGAAGWTIAGWRTDGASITIAVEGHPRDPPVCALFAMPVDANATGLGHVTSQAEANAWIEARIGGRANYALRGERGIRFADSVGRDAQGYLRNFFFVIWESGQASLYEFSCGSPTEEPLRSPHMDNLPDMIRLP